MRKKQTIVSALVLAGISQAADRPNIIWLFSDDHSYQAIGAYKSRLQPLNPTPTIDTLARDGMIFHRCYVGNSICAPSRATLLTGKHSHKNGKINNIIPFNQDQQTFPKILRQHGYQTAMIGKIHLEGNMQGFDYWEVLPGQGRYDNPEFLTEHGKTTYKGTSSDVIVDRALNWLKTERDPNKPFMAMIHFKAPHREWFPAARHMSLYEDVTIPEPDTLWDDYETRTTAAHEQDMSISKTMQMKQDIKIGNPDPRFASRNAFFKENPLTGKELTQSKYQHYMKDYLRCIWGVDENIARILEWLEESGLAENTVVAYSSDQGFYNGEHGWFDKRFMYEESYRTPLIVRWPGVVQPGSENHDLVQNIDFAETFLDMAGAPIPSDMQGVSIVSLLKGTKPDNWRTSLYYHYYEYPGTHSVRRHEGVSESRYKLIRFYGADVPDGEEWEFYDLETDPKELKNRYNDPECSATIESMKKELQKLRVQYEVPSDEELIPPPQKEE